MSHDRPDRQTFKEGSDSTNYWASTWSQGGSGMGQTLQSPHFQGFLLMSQPGIKTGSSQQLGPE